MKTRELKPELFGSVCMIALISLFVLSIGLVSVQNANAVGCGQGWASSEEGEECDDGNTIDGDGCSSTCKIEDGWTCIINPTVCSEICGDGLLVGAERCDDGNLIDGDGCDATCMVEYCGDGTVQAALGEACDDGNTADGDGCSAICTVEYLCGNGILDPGEGCDDGNVVDGDGCSAICLREPACGDGYLDFGEECDDGNTADGDGCSADCAFEGGGQGCTPGYWKQDHHFDSWMGFTPNDMFSAVFGNDAFPGMTLLEVLKQGGGGIKALGRHAVAALLNAASLGVSYDQTTAQVLEMFNGAYVSGNEENIEMAKNALNYFNDLGCPLN